jgi:hypothetical protein
MNGSSKTITTLKYPYETNTSTTAAQYEHFFTTITVPAKAITVYPSTKSFRFQLPCIDDEVQHCCLIGPSLVGIVTKLYHQLCLYDVYRGGLIYTCQPFTPRTITHNPRTMIYCTALLADIKRSKIAIIYTTQLPSDSKMKCCLAYASIGINHHNRTTSVSSFRNNMLPQLSLADGLAASFYSPFNSTILQSSIGITNNNIRTLFVDDESKLMNLYQNKTIVQQQHAIQKGTFGFMGCTNSFISFVCPNIFCN